MKWSSLKLSVACVLTLVVAQPFQPFCAYAEESIDADISTDALPDGDDTEETTLLRSAADAIDSGTWGTCAWELDGDRVLHVHAGTGADCTWHSPWNDKAGFDAVVFDEGVVLPADCSSLFADCTRLATVEASGVDASHVANMSSMFSGCTSLVSLTIAGWDTSSVTNMSSMFRECSKLDSLNVSSWNVSRVRNMHEAFAGCRRLSSLDISAWDVSCVRDMGGTFSGCTSLTDFDLANWETESVADMSSMFEGCAKLTRVSLTDWDVSSVASMDRMFQGCTRLVSIDPSHWDTSSVTSLEWMFSGCSALETLDLSGWDTLSVTRLASMFYGCTSLREIDLSSWDTSSVEVKGLMFSGCSSLVRVSVGRFFDMELFPSPLDNIFRSWTSQLDGGVYSMGDMRAMRKGIADTYDYIPNLASATIYSISSQTYTGEAIEPSFIVQFESEMLEQDRDYTVEYQDNVNVGTATAIIKGKGSYVGAKPTTFNITAARISGASIASIPDQMYTGMAIEPMLTVTFGNKRLSPSTDYTVAYSRNTSVGTARAVISGVGNYSGTKTASFRIVSSQSVFTDVDPTDEGNHGFEVDWMGRVGISTGWETGDGLAFRGLWDVTRCDFAAFLYRMADLLDDGRRNDSIALPPAEVGRVLGGVSDCDAAKTHHAMEIAWMIKSGISRGWQDGGGATVSFRPYAKIARQDMAAFLYRFADIRDDGQQNRSLAMGPERVTFSDVRHGDEANHAPDVEWLASVGVTKGFKSGSRYQFRGTKTVARQDMAAFMYRLYTYLQG